MASPIRSYSLGSTSAAPAADTVPGSFREFDLDLLLAPLDGHPYAKPIRVDEICSAGRHTSFTE